MEPLKAIGPGDFVVINIPQPTALFLVEEAAGLSLRLKQVHPKVGPAVVSVYSIRLATAEEILAALES